MDATIGLFEYGGVASRHKQRSSILSNRTFCPWTPGGMLRVHQTTTQRGDLVVGGMLWWAFLLICYVVTIRLVAATGEVTCDALSSGAVVAIPSSNGSLTPATVLLENCRWEDVDVQLKADGPFVVVLRDVQLLGGSLTVAVNHGVEAATAIRSALIMQSSTLRDCSKCLHVSSMSAPLFHVDLVVAHSTIQATESAVTLAASYIHDCSIRITNSTVEVHSAAKGVTAASAITSNADNVHIEAINSNIAATTTNGMASSMGFASSSITVVANNATLNAVNSTVTATGFSSVASMGFASSNSGTGSTITANNATLFATNSNVTSTGSLSVASMGFASYNYGISSTIIANNASIYTANSRVSATGTSSVASMGFASYSFSGTSTIAANNASLCTANSNVTAAGSLSVASLGFASYTNYGVSSMITVNNATLYVVSSCVTAAGGQFSAASIGFTSLANSNSGTSTITANSATLYAVSSSATATGSNSVASMGFVSVSGTSTITVNSATLYAVSSSVTATGSYFVASMGFATSNYGSSSSTINANNATLYSASGSVAATGQFPVASMGFASNSYTGSGTINANNAMLYAFNSSVITKGSYCVGSIGFTSTGSRTTITANKAMLFSASSSVAATGSQYGVASMGFASSNSGQCTINANNATLFAANSNVTAMGSPCSVTSMGFASNSNSASSTINANNATLYAANSTVTATASEYSVASMGFASSSYSSSCTITANNTMLYAANCTVTATGFRYSVASMGFATYSYDGSFTIIANNTVLVLCSSRLCVSGSGLVAVGSYPPPALPYYTARCLLVRSQIVMPSAKCVTMLDGQTEGAVPSLAMDLSLQCGSVGTLPRCSHNVTGVSPIPSSTSSCPTYNFTGCDDVFPAPARPSIVLVLPGWISGGDIAPSRFARSASQTATAPLSRTAANVASHKSATSQSATPQSTVSLLTANNTCTLTTHSLQSPSVTPSTLLLVAPSARSGTVHVAAQLIGSEAAARAVVSGTSVSAALSSIVSAPSAITSVSRVASLSKVVDCGFGAEIDGEDAVPDTVDLPLHPAVGVSRLRYYVGGVALTSLLLVVLPLLAVLGSHAKLGDTPRSRPTLMWLQQHIFTTFALVCVGFFGPPVVGDGVLLLFFSDPRDWEAVAAGAVGVASVAVAWGLLTAGLWRLPLSIDSSNDVSMAGARLAWNFKRRLCVSLWCFAESSRDLRGVSRFYFSEELLTSCVMAAIANAPRVLGSCHCFALSMAAVAVAHAAFVAVLRPYYSCSDNVWSLLVASLQVALSIVQTAVVYGANGKDVAAALVLALCASFFLQAGFGAVAECVTVARRRVARRRVERGIQEGRNGSDEEGGESLLAVPLTSAINPLADAVPSQTKC